MIMHEKSIITDIAFKYNFLNMNNTVRPRRCLSDCINLLLVAISGMCAKHKYKNGDYIIEVFPNSYINCFCSE